MIYYLLLCCAFGAGFSAALLTVSILRKDEKEDIMTEHNARQLMRALSEIDDLRGEVEHLSSEVTDWQLLVETLLEYAQPKPEDMQEFQRLAHRAVSGLTKQSD